MRSALLALSLLLLPPLAVADERPIEATSLLGQPLTRPTLEAEARARQELLLEEARTDLESSPESLEAWIWVGRRTAYLGRYREAIDIYSDALDRFPDAAELLRHRGHRYISVRRFEEAIADLERAASLREGLEDEVEPDGLPNAAGIPTSTLHTNIAYHLGLARYLTGDFEAALAAYEWCWEISANPDMRAASAYWLYLTLRRLGRETEAAELAASIGDGWELLENHDYYRLLLAYREGSGADRLLEEALAGSELAGSTVGYGVGAWHLVEGRTDRAREIFEQVTSGDGWAAFGFIAAEAELARGATGQSPPDIPACGTIEGFGRLDFWLGHWHVESDGNVVGSNQITKVQEGCAIEEHWTDAEGGTGQSLFYYLPALDEWHQVWVTPLAAAAGGVKQKKLVEMLDDGSVRFQGTITKADGATYLDRTTLTPLADGRVRQHIQLSTDGGATWSEGWVGVYAPMEPTG